jgi:hypothetical protein
VLHLVFLRDVVGGSVGPQFPRPGSNPLGSHIVEVRAVRCPYFDHYCLLPGRVVVNFHRVYCLLIGLRRIGACWLRSWLTLLAWLRVTK